MDFVGIEKLSLVDFDEKISCVLFMQGCNFRCPFCHNRDLALSKIDTFIPFQDVLDYLSSRKNIIDAVVVSGGEPTLMPDLKEKITKIKNMGFLVKIDTNGTNFNVLKDLIDNKLIDYVAMDIKNDFANYPLTAGVSNIDYSNIKKSIEYLINGSIDYEFRTTLVKEFHSEESIKNMSVLLKGAKKLFLQKYIASDSCFNSKLNFVEKKVSQHYIEILKENIDSVELRGY